MSYQEKCALTSVMSQVMEKFNWNKFNSESHSYGFWWSSDNLLKEYIHRNIYTVYKKNLTHGCLCAVSVQFTHSLYYLPCVYKMQFQYRMNISSKSKFYSWQLWQPTHFEEWLVTANKWEWNQCQWLVSFWLIKRSVGARWAAGLPCGPQLSPSSPPPHLIEDTKKSC